MDVTLLRTNPHSLIRAIFKRFNLALSHTLNDNHLIEMFEIGHDLLSNQILHPHNFTFKISFCFSKKFF